MKQGLPPLYATMRDMPAETCQGLLYLMELDAGLAKARAREHAALRDAEERSADQARQVAESFRRLAEV